MYFTQGKCKITQTWVVVSEEKEEEETGIHVHL